MFRAAPRPRISGNGFTHSMELDDFRQRQEADLNRYADVDGEFVVHRRPFHERLEAMQRAPHPRDAYDGDDTAILTGDEDSDSEGAEEVPLVKEGSAGNGSSGEEAWRNKEGERLADFGVDEVAEFYDEDDLPLTELMRRRKAEE